MLTKNREFQKIVSNVIISLIHIGSCKIMYRNKNYFKSMTYSTLEQIDTYEFRVI